MSSWDDSLDQSNPDGKSLTETKSKIKWNSFPFLKEVMCISGEYPELFTSIHLLADAAQVLSLALSPHHEFGRVLTGMLQALYFSHIPLYDPFLSAGMYVCVAVTSFILFVLLLCSIIIMVFSRSTAGDVSKYYFFDSGVFRIYRSLLYLISSTLSVPILQNFLGVSFCQQSSYSKGNLLWFPADSCTSSLGKYTTAEGIVGIILISSITLMMDVFMMESDITATRHPLGRCNAVTDVFYYVYKVISCVLMHYFYATQSMVYFGIWMAGSSFLMAAIYMFYLPYFHESTNQLRITTLLLASTYAAFSALSHASAVKSAFLSDKHIDVAVVIGTFPFLAYIYYQYVALFRVSSYYQHALRGLKNGVLTNPVVHFPKNLPRSVEENPKFASILTSIESQKGGLEHEWEDIAKETEIEVDPLMIEVRRRRFLMSRFVLPYLDAINCPTDVEVSQRFLKYFKDVTRMELSGYQLRYSASVYVKGVCKYTRQTRLKLAYALFLHHAVDFPELAMEVIQESKREEPSVWVSFQLWLLSVDVGNALHLDMSGKAEAFNRAKALHRKALHTTTEFWRLLMNAEVKSSALSASNRVLMSARTDCRWMYQALLAREDQDLDILACYTIFCSDIVDDKDTSEACLQVLRQIVEEREQNKMRGAKTKKAKSGFVHLALSLGYSARPDHEIEGSSSLKMLRWSLIFLSVMSFGVLIGVTIIVANGVKFQRSGLDLLYYYGKVRTLGTEIGFYTLEMQNLSGASLLDAQKQLSGLQKDISTFFNNILVICDSSSELQDFYRTSTVLDVNPTLSLDIWGFFSYSFAAMRDVVAFPKNSTYLNFVLTDFPYYATSSLNASSVFALSVMESKLYGMICTCVPLLAMVLVLQIIMILITLSTLFDVEGIRAVAFSLFKIIPFSDVKQIYRQSLRQHVELDTFFTHSTREKIMRLVGATNEDEKLKLRLGGGDSSALGSRASSSQGSRSKTAYDDPTSADYQNSNGSLSMSSVDSECSSLASSEMTYLEEEEDYAGVTYASERVYCLQNSVQISRNNSVASSVGSKRIKKKKNKKKNKKAKKHEAKQNAYEDQLATLANSRGEYDKAFEIPTLVIFVLLVCALIALAVINILAVNYPNQSQDRMEELVSASKASANLKLEASKLLLSCSGFILSGENRYFKEYISHRYGDAWNMVHQRILKYYNNGTRADAYISLKNMYDGIKQILDICMVLAAPSYPNAVDFNGLSFHNTHLSSLKWGDESSLIITQQAGALHLYITRFGVLKGYVADVSYPSDVKLQNAKKILNSLLLNNFIKTFANRIQDMEKWKLDGQETKEKAAAIASCALSSFSILIIALLVFGENRRSKTLKHYLTRATFLAIIGILSLILGLSVKNYSAVKKVPSFARDVSKAELIVGNWVKDIFASAWLPSRYLDSYSFSWCQLLRPSLSASRNQELVQSLQLINGINLSSSTLYKLFRPQRSTLITLNLIFSATSTLPSVLPYVDAFDPSFFDTFQWNFEKEPDYFQTLASYQNLDTMFYSNRTADMALSDNAKIMLANQTLLSYRQDDYIADNFDFAKSLLVYVTNDIESLKSDLRASQIRSSVCSILSSVASVLTVLIWGIGYAFYVARRARRFSKAEATIKNGNLETKNDTEVNTGMKKKTAENVPKISQKKGQDRQNLQKPRPKDQDPTLTVQGAKIPDKATLDNINKNSGVSNGLGNSGKSTVEFLRRFGPFLALLFIFSLTLALIIALPIVFNQTIRNQAMMEEVTLRTWIVSNSMFSIGKIVQSSSQAIKYQFWLSRLYENSVQFINYLYFGNLEKKSSGYRFVGKDFTQDNLLFDRNDFYGAAQFLGPGVAATNNLVFPPQVNTNASLKSTSPFFCSYGQQRDIMSQYGRGVGLIFDDVWLSFIRRAAFELPAGIYGVYNDMRAIYQAVITGLSQSSLLYLDSSKKTLNDSFSLVLALCILDICAVAFSLFFVFLPFTSYLVREDTNTRLLIRMVPSEIRGRSKVFNEYLESMGKILENDRLSAVVEEVSQTATIVADKEGTILRFNELAEDMFGYSAAEAIGKNLTILMDEATAARHKEGMSRFKPSSSTMLNRTTEVAAKKKNGKPFVAAIRLTLLPLPDDSYVFISFIEEVPDRKEIGMLRSINETLMEQNGDILIIISEEGIITYINTSGATTFGYTRQEMIGNNVSMIMPSEVGSVHNKYLQAYRETGITLRINSRTVVQAVTKGGTAFNLFMVVHELKRAGEPSHFLGYLEDTSRQREVEAKNNVSTAIIDLSSLPIVAMNERGSVLKMSNAACNLFQIKREEITSINVQNFVPEKYGDHNLFVKRYLQTGVKHVVGLTRNVVAQKRDRTTFPASLTLKEISSEGLPHLFLGFIRDVSGTLQLEESGTMVYEILKAGPWPILVSTATGIINFCNSSTEGVFGYTKEEMVGKPYSILLIENHAEALEKMISAFTRGMGTKAFQQKKQLLGRRKNGEPFPLEIQLSFIPSVKGSEMAVVSFMRDLSEEQKITQRYYTNEAIGLLSPMSIIIVDLYGTIDSFSVAAEECFGYSASEVIGASIRVLIPSLGDRRFNSLSDSEEEQDEDLNRSAEYIKNATIREHVVDIREARHSDGHVFSITVVVRELREVHVGRTLFCLCCEDLTYLNDTRRHIAFHRSMRDLFGVPLAHMNEEGALLYTNSAFNEELLYKASDIIGKPLASIIPELDSVMESIVTRSANSRAIKKGERAFGRSSSYIRSASKAATTLINSGDRLVRATRSDGSAVAMGCKVVEVVSPHTGTVSYIAYFSNREFQAQQEIANQFNNTFASVNLFPIIVVDHRGIVIKFSEAAQDLFGYSGDDVVGHNVKMLMPKEVADHHDEYFCRYQITQKGNLMDKTTIHLARHQDGTFFAVSMTLREVNRGSDQPIFIACVSGTAEIEAEKQTLETEKRLMDRSPMPMVVTDKNGVIEAVNEALCAEFFYMKDELIGKDVGILMTESDAAYHRRHISNYFKTKLQFSIGNTVKRKAQRKNGESFQINVHVRQVETQGASKEELRFIGYFISDDNCNDPKNSTLSPETILVNNGPIPYLLLDENCIIQRVSLSAETSFGYSPGEKKGAHFTDFLFHGNCDTPTAKEFDTFITGIKRLTLGESLKRQITAVKRSGEHLPVEICIQEVDTAAHKLPWKLLCVEGSTANSENDALNTVRMHGVRLFVGYLNEVHDEAKSRHLKDICEGAVDLCSIPTIIINTSGIISTFNKAAELCFGYRAGDAVGKNVSMLMPSGTAAIHDTFISAYLRTQKHRVIGQKRAVTAQRKDGTRFDAMLSVREIQNESGHFFIGNVEDVSASLQNELVSVLNQYIVNETDNCIFVLDSHDAVSLASPQALKLFQYAEEDLKSLDAASLLFTPNVYKEYKEFAHLYQFESGDHEKFSKIMELRSKKILPQLEIKKAQMRRRDGTTLVLDLSMCLVLQSDYFNNEFSIAQNQGMPYKNCGLIASVFRLKSSQSSADHKNEIYTKVAHDTILHYPKPYFVLNRCGQFFTCNNAFASLLSYRGAEEAEAALKDKPITTVLETIVLPDKTETVKEDIMESETEPNIIKILHSSSDGAQSLEYERKCMSELDKIVAQCEKIAKEPNGPPFLLKARRRDGKVFDVMLEQFSILHSPQINADSPKQCTPKANAQYDLHYYGGVIVDIMAARGKTIPIGLRSEVFRLSPSPMVLINSKGIILELNQPLLDVFDFKREQLIGHNISLLMPHNIAEMHDGYLSDFFATGKKRMVGSTQHVTGETRMGEEVALEVSVEQVSVDGEICFVASMVVDYSHEDYSI